MSRSRAEQEGQEERSTTPPTGGLSPTSAMMGTRDLSRSAPTDAESILFKTGKQCEGSQD